MADLRGASFKKANLDSSNFENAKVHSVSMNGALINNIPNCFVDNSENGDGSNLIPVNEWLKKFDSLGS